jgi:hypothetical protein
MSGTKSWSSPNCIDSYPDEIAFLLGHRDANVTRAVYVPEVADARRRSMRRSRMVAEFGGALRVALSPGDEAD